MSSTWLEQIRTNLEQLELLDKAITQELFVKCDNPKESVIVDHKIKNFIDQKQNKCLDSLILINDADNSKKEEIEILSGTKSLNPHATKVDLQTVWFNFYERLREIKDYHKRYNPPVLQSNTVQTLRENVFMPPFKEPEFTGEENQGRYVDMNILYQEFINLKNIKQDYKMGDYLQYLQNFEEFHEIPYNLKEKDYKKYKRYLENLVNYLREFFIKTQPLTDFPYVEKQINEDFDTRWKEGTLRGWEQNLKPENINEMLANPLYCKYCKHLFQNDHIFVHHLPGKKHKKLEKLAQKEDEGNGNGNNNQNNNNNLQSNSLKNNNSSTITNKLELAESNLEGVDQNEKKKKGIAYLECYVVRMKELLGDIIHDTTNQIRKRQTRTYEEMEAENYNPQDLQEIVQDDEEDEEPVYNPKNLPLGWDGKPIPYWLYKLHGLGIEYKCEICGNYSYWGRRAFERHFSEWRHSYGMKCLKIPNTIHFKEITSINDALALHQKLLMESELSQFKPDQEEEFEDSEGNPLNKKLYYDLKRQGLL